jgi:uncharacterized protein DUF2252
VGAAQQDASAETLAAAAAASAVGVLSSTPAPSSTSRRPGRDPRSAPTVLVCGNVHVPSSGMSGSPGRRLGADADADDVDAAQPGSFEVVVERLVASLATVGVHGQRRITSDGSLIVQLRDLAGRHHLRAALAYGSAGPRKPVSRPLLRGHRPHHGGLR